MKKSRKFSLSLGRTFDRSANPTYIVSAEREVVYMNAACLQWLGVEAETVEEARCYYTSESAQRPKDDIVSGLCPPPELLSETPDGTWTLQTQIFRRSEENASSLPASMVRLSDEENGLVGVLVVAASAPIDLEQDDATTAKANESQTLHAALAAIRNHHRKYFSVGNLIGSSPFAARLRRQVAAIVDLDAEILITGPTGSGREHLARTIATTKSTPDDLPMEVLHCVLADEALTTETLDRVTAAARLNETSRVAIASKNKSAPLLLLLDIDKLPAASLVVVGDFLRHQAHACRIIATSEQPLVHLAATGEFPASLAHQISTLEINLLSLSQRGEDIPLLAQAFVEHANRVSDQQLSGFDASAMSMLTEFHWPGNFEQLQLVVASTCERAASRPGATSIKTNDFPDSFRHAIKAARIGRPEEAIIDLQQWLDELEKELIQRALGQAGGNKTKAAQLLTMTRSRLVRRVDHLQLPQVPPQTDAKEMIDSSAFEELD